MSGIFLDLMFWVLFFFKVLISVSRNFWILQDRQNVFSYKKGCSYLSRNRSRLSKRYELPFVLSFPEEPALAGLRLCFKWFSVKALLLLRSGCVDWERVSLVVSAHGDLDTWWRSGWWPKRGSKRQFHVLAFTGGFS